MFDFTIEKGRCNYCDALLRETIWNQLQKKYPKYQEETMEHYKLFRELARRLDKEGKDVETVSVQTSDEYYDDDFYIPIVASVCREHLRQFLEEWK